jgi:hypothetical protein
VLILLSKMMRRGNQLATSPQKMDQDTPTAIRADSG